MICNRLIYKNNPINKQPPIINIKPIKNSNQTSSKYPNKKSFSFPFRSVSVPHLNCTLDKYREFKFNNKRFIYFIQNSDSTRNNYHKST